LNEDEAHTGGLMMTMLLQRSQAQTWWPVSVASSGIVI
jgi:hypothetical protein